MVQIRTGFLSITGDYRENNEDSGAVDPEGRFFLVADGMGGQSAGERASALATEIVPRQLDQQLDFESGDIDAIAAGIDQAVNHANAEIMALGEVDPDARNMGTTLVYLVHAAGRFLIGGVGDSRVYLLRDGELRQLTRDHSLTQALLEAGTITAEEAENHRYRNVLYRYLGTKEGGGGTDPVILTPEPGDRVLLCSDGVTDGADDETICSVLSAALDPQAACVTLVEAAKEGGSRDNITALVIFVTDDAASE